MLGKRLIADTLDYLTTMKNYVHVSIRHKIINQFSMYTVLINVCSNHFCCIKLHYKSNACLFFIFLGIAVGESS